MPEIGLDFALVQHRDGANIDVFGCIMEGDRKQCTQVDRIKFDRKMREAGIPNKMKDVLTQATGGEYQKQACDRFGFKWTGGRCSEKPATKSVATTTKRTSSRRRKK